MTTSGTIDCVLREVERASEEVVALTSALIRIPTVNPPGEHYEDCARFIGDQLVRLGHESKRPRACINQVPKGRQRDIPGGDENQPHVCTMKIKSPAWRFPDRTAV